MKKVLLYTILLFATVLQAQFRNYSNEFLNIGVDAAAFGMSKSVVATTNDVNASYWNPAGLTQVKDYQGTLMHASYFANIANFNYAGFAMSIDDKSAVGISIIRFGVDDILNTTELIDSEGNINFNNISLFSTADYAFNVAYAKNILIEGLSFGANTKIIRRIIGDFANSWGFGFDVGFQYQSKKWSYGLMLRDITTTFNAWSINEEEFQKISDAIDGQNQELPESTEFTRPKFQLGIARNFALSDHFNLLSEIDANIRFFETNDIISSGFASIDPSLGFQLDYEQFAFLRVGAGNFQRVTQFDESTNISVQPNFGVGFRYKGIQIDYALTNIGSVGNALYSNIFSIKLDYSFFR